MKNQETSVPTSGAHSAANDEHLETRCWPSSFFTPVTRQDILGRGPLQWAVKELLPAKGLAILYGPSAVGKSFLTLDLACALARGRPWFGQKTSQANVMYINLEGQAGMRQRILAWEAEHGHDLPDNLCFIEQPLDLRDPTVVEQLLLAWRDFYKSSSGQSQRAVFIFDTLARCMPGADENSSGDMGLVLGACQLLIDELDALVILVHHTGKDSDRGPRGHSSLTPALDASLLVTAKGSERMWIAQKEKDAPDGVCGKFSLKVHQLGLDEDGEPITSCVVVSDGALSQTPAAGKMPGHLTHFMQAIRDIQPDGAVAPLHLPKDKIRERFKSRCGLSGSGERSAWGRATELAQDRGWVSMEGDFVNVSELGFRVTFESHR